MVVILLLLLLSHCTSIIASGQIIAHIAQPVHSLLLVSAGKYPFLLEFLDMMMLFLGQTIKQSPQPLHLSVSIIILPAICLFRLIVRFRDCKSPFAISSKRILTSPSAFVKEKASNHRFSEFLYFWQVFEGVEPEDFKEFFCCSVKHRSS